MELLTVSLAIFTIAEKVFNLRDKFSSKKENESTKLNSWLLSTGDLLSSVAKGLRENRYPHEKCSQLKYTLDHMSAALEPYFEDREIGEFYALIDSAFQVEKLFGEMQTLSAEEKEKNICLIENAVGKFYAAANFANL